MEKQLDMADNDLVARLSRGDEVALRELYRRYASLVFTVAVRIVPAPQAEEVVQDVFLTLWRKHDAFDPARGSFKTWLVNIAKNRALNEARRARLRRETGDDVLQRIQAESLEPDEAQWSRHRQQAVRAAVDALPPDLARTLSLAFLDELTHEQVAAALGTPLGTTKTRIRTGLKRLAPVLSTAIAAVLIAVGAIVWRHAKQEERALVVVTSSDVVPRRLEAAAGIPSEAHGQFRARPGSNVAVLTTTKLPPLRSGEVYVAWARHGAHFTQLGIIHPGDEAHALLVAEDSALATAPGELVVTRETTRGAAPTGRIVLFWKP